MTMAGEIIFNDFGYSVVLTSDGLYVACYGDNRIISTSSELNAMSCIVAHQAGRLSVMRTYAIQQERLRELDRYD